jgi:carboxyl-terminal processing protease
VSKAARRGVIVAVLVGGLIAGMWLGGHPDSLPDPLRDLFTDQPSDRSSQIVEAVEDNYFREVDPGSLEGKKPGQIVRELRRRYDDRFSHYFDPKTFKRFNEVIGGEFSGVGLSITEANEGLRVSRAFKGSPAADAQISEGDVVTAVDGRSIANEDAEFAANLIKGPEGTEVKLTVLTPSTGETRELTLTREKIRVPVVESKLRQVGTDPVGYVRLLSFTKGVHAELREAIERLDERGARGLVLDLRGNGGGLLTEGILVSSLFVEDGVIVSTSARTQGDREYEAVGSALPERPMVVLVDKGTASAAEILAAALAEEDLGTVVGQQTFGKGSFQQVFPLEKGGGIELTVGEYLTGSGRSLAEEGFEPEVTTVDREETKQDEALDRALRVLGRELRS